MYLKINYIDVTFCYQSLNYIHGGSNISGQITSLTFVSVKLALITLTLSKCWWL